MDFSLSNVSKNCLIREIQLKSNDELDLHCSTHHRYRLLNLYSKSYLNILSQRFISACQILLSLSSFNSTKQQTKNMIMIMNNNQYNNNNNNSNNNKKPKENYKFLFFVMKVILIILVSLLVQQCTHGLMVNASTSPQIISPPSEIIAYINHTARLSCIIQNKESHHVFWSRYTIVNDTYKLSDVLFINLLKFSSYPHYHLTRKVDKTTEHWNLEIRNIQPLDEGYYGCALSTSEPIIKYSFVRVLETVRNQRNELMALRSANINSNSTLAKSYSASSVVRINKYTSNGASLLYNRHCLLFKTIFISYIFSYI